MTSVQEKVDAVKTAVSSISSCLPSTLTIIKDLLLSDAGPVSTTTVAKTKAASRATTKTPSRTKTTTGATTSQLSSKEKTALATHVVNATIKTLGEAAKPTPSSADPPKPAESSDPHATTGRRPLRRSLSAPLSPVQPRSLNRVTTSPTAVPKAAKQPPAGQSTACLATVECARVAFACLRNLKGPLAREQTDLQIEIGMSVFAGKLVALGMHELALKELRLLHRRLDVAKSATATGRKLAKQPAQADSPMTISDLLSFHAPVPANFLAAVTTCQLQVLKLIAATKKPAHIEAALAHLRDTQASSPVNLLSALAETGSKEVAKAARQLALLSQTVLSLAPSVSSLEDAVAMEPRLSPSPLVSFELQTLAFTCQLRWWKMGGHSGRLDEELLSPLSRCLRSLGRRFDTNEVLLYETMKKAVEGVLQLAKSYGYVPTVSPTCPIAIIYQVLGATAFTAKRYNDATHWFSKLRSTIQSPQECSVRYASVCAWLLAASLKSTESDIDTEKLAQTVLESLDGSLSGTVNELNELLDSLSLARRSAVGRLTEILNPSIPQGRAAEPIDDLLKSFVLYYPCFVRRWLGNVPGKDAPTKHILQFDQRRQLVIQTIGQTLDATLMVVKCDIQAEKAEWKQFDEVLQHCSGLIETLNDPLQSTARSEQLKIYLIKISSLYFAKFSQLRKQSQRSRDESKQLLQTLSRSIDAVKDLSAADRERAQLSTKLEIFADMCKGAGRTDDAVQTLRSICTSMAEDGILKDVSAALSHQAPTIAWNMNGKCSMLSRTLRSIARLDSSWTDWTVFLPETQRAAVLEHLMHLGSSSRGPLSFRDVNLTALLRIYTPDKYPIRRLRVLLCVLYQNIGNEDEVSAIHAHVQVCLRQVRTQDRAEDENLAGFVPHLVNWHNSIQAILDADQLSSSAVPDAIDTWAAMMESCQTESSIYKVIDDPDALQDHLQCLCQLAGLRGEYPLQLKISQLLVSLSKVFAGHGQTTGSTLIVRQSQLASHYISAGFYSKALDVLDEAKSLLQQQSEVAPSVTVAYHLAQAEYFTGLGSTENAQDSISQLNTVCRRSHSSWAANKAQATVTTCLASLLQSSLSLQSGNTEDALNQVKQSVRMLSHDWAKLESITAGGEPASSDTSIGSVELKNERASIVGPKVWALVSPLVRSLLHLSSVYAHIGMFQETIYYADTASKIAAESQSILYSAEVAAWTGSVYLRAGDQENAASRFIILTGMMPTDICSARIRYAQLLGEYYSQIGDNEKSVEYMEMAEAGARSLGSVKKESEVVQIEEAPPVSLQTKKPSRATRTKTVSKPPATKRKAVPSKAVTPMVKPALELPTDAYQASLLASVLLSRATSTIRQRDWTTALDLLAQAKQLPKHVDVVYQEQVATATTLIGHSMEQIISDPVFSVIQDSTISFPSVAGLVEKVIADGCSPCKSPAKRGRAALASRTKAGKDQNMPAFAKALKEAQDLLAEAHSTAVTKSDSGMVRRISALLQSTIILLSAACSAKHESIARSSLATVAVDHAHNVTWRREQKTIAAPDAEPQDCQGKKRATPRRVSLAPTSDMAIFHKSYIEMMPKNWNVISISLSDNHHDLCLTKFQAGHSPFILRLPLERANSRDGESDVYNFEHGKAELLDIIKLANETSHSARDFSLKGERNAWWAQREALDSRLKQCLMQIETTWLGGFRGIFSQHEHRADLLARLQKNVQKMLDAHLPSRSQRRGKKVSKSAVSLDARILDLFVGLGDPVCDLDEALNDLLYFVVDILQFQGERNAYDEIDFDAMMVEMYDALRGYHGALEDAEARGEGAHTILVLDKALHVFPWESLPCMKGLAVSRVPSLACLRQLITGCKLPSRAEEKTELEGPAGHYVSAGTGTYMLNPSSDLNNTQAFFEGPFAKRLRGWKSILNRAPEEEEFAQALETSEVMLYFGHGSGAQYIRGKTVRRLERCRAVTFLMGCSSAALTEAGEFECYGPVWNYMMAGCPAVVGTLWDVTDRDIDRFAGQTFEEWGLFTRGTFGGLERCGNGSGDDEDDDDEDESRVVQGCTKRTRSLVEAVAQSRDACRLRYLNAAAVVVYGIPVYMSGED